MELSELEAAAERVGRQFYPPHRDDLVTVYVGAVLDGYAEARGGACVALRNGMLRTAASLSLAAIDAYALGWRVGVLAAEAEPEAVTAP